MTDDDKRARSRFMMLNLVRLSGLAMVLVGIAGNYGKIDMPAPVALILVVLGFFEFFFVPNILARKWRTPDR